jgi:hypothetical protein
MSGDYTENDFMKQREDITGLLLVVIFTVPVIRFNAVRNVSHFWANTLAVMGKLLFIPCLLFKNQH